MDHQYKSMCKIITSSHWTIRRRKWIWVLAAHPRQLALHCHWWSRTIHTSHGIHECLPSGLAPPLDFRPRACRTRIYWTGDVVICVRLSPSRTGSAVEWPGGCLRADWTWRPWRTAGRPEEDREEFGLKTSVGRVVSLSLQVCFTAKRLVNVKLMPKSATSESAFERNRI